MPVADDYRIPAEAGEEAAIDPSSPIPLYFQLKTYLLQQILRGRYGAGERLPTEHELCKRLGASRTPVHRALAELAEEGVIIRRPRLGTFVNPHWAQRNRDGPELRVLVPEGPWDRHVRQRADGHVTVTVASVSLPDLHHALTTALAEGRGPDLALIDSVWVPEFSSAGFLWALDEIDPDWVAGEYDADFLEPFVSANRYEGHPVAVQAEADVAGIWYRREALDRAGLAVPTTWEELRAAAEGLRAGRSSSTRHPIVMPAGSRAGETATYCLLALLASNGVKALENDGVTVDSPGAVDAISFLEELIDEGVMPADVVAYEWDRAIRRLAKGQAAIALGGSYDARMLATVTGSSLEQVWDRFGFARIPAGPRGGGSALAGGMVWVVPRQALQPRLAMRALARAVSAEASADMSRATAQIPPRSSAVSLVAPDSQLVSASAAMLAGAAVRPATPSYPRVSTQLQVMLETVLTGTTTPKAAVSRCAELVSAITGLPIVTR